MVRACCSSVRPAWVGVTPCRARTSSGAPSACSMLRMRVEAAASARWARSAPWVMVPASTTWRNRLRSARVEAHGQPSCFAKEDYRKSALLGHYLSPMFRLRRSNSDAVSAGRRAAFVGTAGVRLPALRHRRPSATNQCRAGRDRRSENDGRGQDNAPEERPLSPHLQIYKPLLTMMMSIVHRITGGALYFGMLLLVWWLIAAAAGPNAYASVQWFMETLLGRLILFGYTWALIHHMLGGIRHLIWDLGYGFGPVEREWLTRGDAGRLDRLHHPGLDRRLSGHGRHPMTEHTPHSMRTPLGRVRHLGSAHHGTRHFWHQRLTVGRQRAADHRRDRDRHRPARPQSRRGGADPRLAAGGDHDAAVHRHQRLSHVARHAGHHRGLRA